MRFSFLAAALALAACATATPAPSLDALAERYVSLALEYNTHDDGFVDAYYGPEALKTHALASRRTLAALEADADALLGDLRGVRAEGMEARRRDFLEAYARAMRTRMAMQDGQRLSFRDEARLVFGVTPTIRPLSEFDVPRARLDRMLPGDGPLDQRVEAFRARYLIPPARYEAVIRAAIAECRRRTLEHISLPEDESFTLEFVTDKPWSGYNWYQGGHRSLIQINTDQPISIDRAIVLGCHEGYPGHHTHNVLMETELSHGRHWLEFTLFPLYSPISYIAEGEADHGIKLAFPDEERMRFEQRVLYPLANLDPATAPAYEAFLAVMNELQDANVTITQMLIDGEIDRARAVDLMQHYLVRSRVRAEQAVAFSEAYRAYVINYTQGERAVGAALAAAGPDPAARWARLARILSEPTLPHDLAAAP